MCIRDSTGMKQNSTFSVFCILIIQMYVSKWVMPVIMVTKGNHLNFSPIVMMDVSIPEKCNPT
ncbi:MAG: hypothetical protein MPK62_15640, partial [Alphaproteobacteria bacterium]|nr:hypothetical protein [Alphaproteobacteria bacterium]